MIVAPVTTIGADVNALVTGTVGNVKYLTLVEKVHFLVAEQLAYIVLVAFHYM